LGRRLSVSRISGKYWVEFLLILPIASIGVTLAIYISHFSNGFSDQQSVWAYFGSYFGGIVSPILSFFSFGTALILLYRTIRSERVDQVYEFMKEFKSVQMSKDLKTLWDFYDYGGSTTKLHKLPKSKRPIQLKKNYPDEQREGTDIYYARRNVSYFYLYLSIFMQKNRLEKSITDMLWPMESLNTLRDIIIPCEESILSPGVVSNKLKHFEYLARQ
jgi:uncharacterized membrane protein